MLTIVDTFTRFSPATEVRFNFCGTDVVEVLERVGRELGFPSAIRVDQGTEFVSRDLDLWAEDFFVLAGSIMPSHVHVHVVEVATVVSVAGMIVSPNDVIHADRHGAVVVPAEVIKLIPAAAELIAQREKVLIDAAKSPDFSIDRLRQAFAEVFQVH